jgi:hypothetical protein
MDEIVANDEKEGNLRRTWHFPGLIRRTMMRDRNVEKLGERGVQQ